MSGSVQPEDLAFFSVLAGRGSLTATARELGISTAAVSKHLAQMEARAAVALVNRTTRRMSLTAEGEIYLAHARRILGEMEELAQLLGGARAAPKGLLRVNATLGFGRSHVAPVDLAFRAALSGSRRAIAAVGRSAADQQRCLRRLRALRRATGTLA